MQPDRALFQTLPLALDRQLSSYDYELPEGMIAQSPATPRDHSRLLVVERDVHQHSRFDRIGDYLRPGDLLVMNNTAVIPARLLGHKLQSREPLVRGMVVEVFLLEPQTANRWLALVKPGRRLKPGSWVCFDTAAGFSLLAEILETDGETRGRLVQFHLPPDHCLMNVLHSVGQVPLPPYIQNETVNPDRYQTVYASQPGSVAAPTAGLHFTPDLLAQLADQGIEQASVTLHVGIGTFRPVETDNITDHRMHGEWIDVPAHTVEAIAQARTRGGRVIAVGTTSVRALESMAQQHPWQAFQGKSELFIYPGYRWRVVDGLITNFHLPRSSLMMMVSALITRPRLLALYQVAIAENYRFYSFGDAMLILPTAVPAMHRAP
jgi:S-adenosylmethionine:tRNA ribosyltransferase-isomerase